MSGALVRPSAAPALPCVTALVVSEAHAVPTSLDQAISRCAPACRPGRPFSPDLSLARRPGIRRHSQYGPPHHLVVMIEDEDGDGAGRAAETSEAADHGRLRAAWFSTDVVYARKPAHKASRTSHSAQSSTGATGSGAKPSLEPHMHSLALPHRRALARHRGASDIPP